MTIIDNVGGQSEYAKETEVNGTLRAGGQGCVAYALQGGVSVDSNGKQAGKGAPIQTEKSATLGTHNDQTLFQPKVYGICSKDSNAMKSANPHSGFYEADTSRTLDRNGGNPSCNQGGMAVVALEGNGARPSHRGSGYSEDNVSFTLNATERHAVAVEHYCASKNSFFTDARKEQANTLVATDYKDPPCINDWDGADYIVRRLTPTECARLQGFPDDWGKISKKDDFTDEEMDFWNAVYVTHQLVVKGREVPPKTKPQLLNWYNKLWTDSAEYKMWGNGVALPCVRVPIHNMAKYGAKTLASLFDGSGGFPLAGMMEGIDPIWCSEIEPYPIAVTMERFPEAEDDWLQ